MSDSCEHGVPDNYECTKCKSHRYKMHLKAIAENKELKKVLASARKVIRRSLADNYRADLVDDAIADMAGVVRRYDEDRKSRTGRR